MTINHGSPSKEKRSKEEQDRQEISNLIDVTILNIALILIAFTFFVLLVYLFHETATVWLSFLEDCRL